MQCYRRSVSCIQNTSLHAAELFLSGVFSVLLTQFGAPADFALGWLLISNMEMKNRGEVTRWPEPHVVLEILHKQESDSLQGVLGN